jgi:hypothetical protein
VSHARSGLAWGTGAVSIATAVIIIGVVAYLAVTHVDVAQTSTGTSRNMRSS